MPSGYKIIMGVVELNKILGISLGVSDIEDVYDLCKFGDDNTYYLRVMAKRSNFVAGLEDSYQYAGDDCIFVRGEWEFGKSETSRSLRILRHLGTPLSKDRDPSSLSFSAFMFAVLTSVGLLCRFSPEKTKGP